MSEVEDNGAGTCVDEDVPGVHGAHARVGVLFSGGLDSTVVAALAHYHVPIDQVPLP